MVVVVEKEAGKAFAERREPEFWKYRQARIEAQKELKARHQAMTKK